MSHETTARALVKIVPPENEWWGVHINNTTYLHQSEESAVIERESWVAFLTAALDEASLVNSTITLERTGVQISVKVNGTVLPFVGLDLTTMLSEARREEREVVAKELDVRADKILQDWEHDKEVPHTTHDPKDCHDRCDGYCIANMEFTSFADWCRQRGETR